MTYEKLKTNKAVIYARLLGFEAFGQSLSARKHYHWYMPEGDDTFSVSVFKGVPNYTVNRQSTTNLEQACKWLQKIEHQSNERLQAEIRYVTRCYTTNGVHPDPK